MRLYTIRHRQADNSGFTTTKQSLLEISRITDWAEVELDQIADLSIGQEFKVETLTVTRTN